MINILFASSVAFASGIVLKSAQNQCFSETSFADRPADGSGAGGPLVVPQAGAIRQPDSLVGGLGQAFLRWRDGFVAAVEEKFEKYIGYFKARCEGKFCTTTLFFF